MVPKHFQSYSHSNATEGVAYEQTAPETNERLKKTITEQQLLLQPLKLLATRITIRDEINTGFSLSASFNAVEMLTEYDCTSMLHAMINRTKQDHP